jgi:hypothetical protein
MLWSIWITGALLFIVSALMWRTVNLDYHMYDALRSYDLGWAFNWHLAVYTWAYTVVNVFRWLTVPFLVAVTVWQCIKAAHHMSTTTSHV